MIAQLVVVSNVGQIADLDLDYLRNANCLIRINMFSNVVLVIFEPAKLLVGYGNVFLS